jgi:hypothetical protein
MSRAKNSESLHEVQLFPFVAVLLCTMGGLLVLLVILTRSSKERAAIAAVAAQADARAAATARASEIKQSNEAARRQLETLGKYQAELDAARKQATEQLRHDQLRLSHLEDHMMRLREQLESLQIAAAELNALEGEHVDDRKLAEQEIARLERLIADSMKEIEQLRAETKARSKSFAIVPYQGKNGTFRRPIYIECGPDEVVIQPEGIVFTADDFQPPIGPGNPLVAALRAAREHIIASSETAGKAAEPYPLIIVRPAGIDAYYHVREAIQSWDSEFGYELVEQDWELKYSAADPQLAVKEQAAADLARARLRALAEAAPQAFAAYRSGGGGRGRRGFATGGYGAGPGGPPSGGGSGGFDEDEFDYEVAELPAGGPRLASRPGGPSVVAVQRSDAKQREGTLGSGKRPGEASTAENHTSGSGLSDDRYAPNASNDGADSAGAAADAASQVAGGGPQPGGASQQPLDEMERQPNGAPAPGQPSPVTTLKKNSTNSLERPPQASKLGSASIASLPRCEARIGPSRRADRARFRFAARFKSNCERIRWRYFRRIHRQRNYRLPDENFGLATRRTRLTRT